MLFGAWKMKFCLDNERCGQWQNTFVWYGQRGRLAVALERPMSHGQPIAAKPEYRTTVALRTADVSVLKKAGLPSQTKRELWPIAKIHLTSGEGREFNLSNTLC